MNTDNIEKQLLEDLDKKGEEYKKWVLDNAIQLRKVPDEILFRKIPKNYSLLKQSDLVKRKPRKENLENGVINFGTCVITSFFNSYSFLFDNNKEIANDYINKLTKFSNVESLVSYFNKKFEHICNGSILQYHETKNPDIQLKRKFEYQLNKGIPIVISGNRIAFSEDDNPEGHAINIIDYDKYYYTIFENAENNAFIQMDAYSLIKRLIDKSKKLSDDDFKQFMIEYDMIDIYNALINKDEKLTLDKTINYITNGQQNKIRRDCIDYLRYVNYVIINFKALNNYKNYLKKREEIKASTTDFSELTDRLSKLNEKYLPRRNVLITKNIFDDLVELGLWDRN